MFLYLRQTLTHLYECVNYLVFHKKGTGNCFKSQFRCLFVRICLLSFYFSLNYLLPDCYMLRTPTILPQYSHIVKLTLHFLLILWACPKVIFPPLCKHRWKRPFDTVILLYYFTLNAFIPG